MPGPASAFYRLLFASLLLCPYVAITHQRTSLSRRSLWLAAVGGIFFAGDLGFYSTAVLHSSAANATVLANNTPIAVGFLAWMLTGTRPVVAFWTGLAIALSGSVMIVGEDLLRHADFGVADLFALASAGCFAVYLYVTEKMREEFDTSTLLALSLVASTIALLIFNLGARVPMHIPTRGSWIALLGLALVCQLLGYFALTYALGHLSAGITSVTLLLQAPLTAVLAFFFLGEPVTGPQVLGGILVLLGVWIVNRYSQRQTMLAE
jgi:drug/metabolite transporter (DMT)-like permease